MITQILDHITRAKDRLREQYKENPEVNYILDGIGAGIQQEEDMFNDMMVSRTLDGSFGKQLDLLGTIVGLARVPGQDDETYRALIKAKIGQNVSEGEPESVLSFWKTLTNATKIGIRDGTFGEIALSANLDFTQTQVNKFMKDLRAVVAAGVRVDGIESFDDTEAFTFQGALAGLGFGSDTNPAAGGKFATVSRQNDVKFTFAGTSVNSGGFGSVYDPIIGGVWAGI